MENQTYGQQFGQNIGDAVQILQSLLLGRDTTSGMPFPAAISSGLNAGMALGNTQVGQNPVGEMAKAALSPYQEGVKKAMKESGYAHATEAVQSGVPPTHIEQQAGLSQNYTSTPANNMMQSSTQGLLGPGQEQGQYQGYQVPKQPTPTQQTNQPDILGGLLNMLRSGARAANAGPISQLAQADLVRQQTRNITPGGGMEAVGIAESKKPLTQEQQVNMQAGINTATREGLNQANERIQANLTALQTQYDQEAKIAPIWTKNPITGRSARMQQIQDQIDLQQGAALQLQNKLNNWKPTKFTSGAKTGNYNEQQKQAYNLARAKGLSVEQAKKRAGL